MAEKRLIDANSACNRCRMKNCGNCGCCIIGTEPTVDAVEVVRCKDCEHRIYVDMGDEIGAVGGCELFGIAMHYDCFCSYGERNDGDKDYGKAD